jgi:glycine betaine/proline transport system substrate-binding protein
MKFTHTALVAAAVGLAGPALAADPESCATITMSDPGWSDITSTNALASAVLSGLGYEADIKSLSVPIGYEALKSGDLDVFLGNWMPAQTAFREDLRATASINCLLFPSPCSSNNAAAERSRRNRTPAS